MNPDKKDEDPQDYNLEVTGESPTEIQKSKIAEITSSESKSKRAEEILNEMYEDKKASSSSMKNEVRKNSARAKVTEYGKYKLPAGPKVYESEDIIVVEGKADVENLLKMGIENTIALAGTNLPSSVKHLCHQRTVTVLLDGDRGGDSILKELLLKTKIEYVARAPKGKEVENLSYTEIKDILELHKRPVLQAEFIDDNLSVIQFLKRNNRKKYLR